jgi:hypothetical protein
MQLPARGPRCDAGSEHDGRRHGNGSAAATEDDGSAHGGEAAYAPQDEATAGATSSDLQGAAKALPFFLAAAGSRKKPERG